MCRTPPHQQPGGVKRRFAVAECICTEHARALYPNPFQSQAGSRHSFAGKVHHTKPVRYLHCAQPLTLCCTLRLRRGARAQGGSAAHMKQAPAMNTGMAVCRLRSWYLLLLQATTCGAPLPPQRTRRAAGGARAQHRRGAHATAAPRRGWALESGTRARPGHRHAHASLRQPRSWAPERPGHRRAHASLRQPPTQEPACRPGAPSATPGTPAAGLWTCSPVAAPGADAAGAGRAIMTMPVGTHSTAEISAILAVCQGLSAGATLGSGAPKPFPTRIVSTSSCARERAGSVLQATDKAGARAQCMHHSSSEPAGRSLQPNMLRCCNWRASKAPNYGLVQTD